MLDSLVDATVFFVVSAALFSKSLEIVENDTASAAYFWSSILALVASLFFLVTLFVQ